jgi:hypothetical protein
VAWRISSKLFQLHTWLYGRNKMPHLLALVIVPFFCIIVQLGPFLKQECHI